MEGGVEGGPDVRGRRRGRVSGDFLELGGDEGAVGVEREVRVVVW